MGDEPDRRLTLSRFESFDPKRCGTLVLGACELGMVKRTGRDERLGFARSGFAAGASAVVAARWATEDVMAAAVLDAFHTNLWALPRDVALQRAMQAAPGRLKPRQNAIPTIPCTGAVGACSGPAVLRFAFCDPVPCCGGGRDRPRRRWQETTDRDQPDGVAQAMTESPLLMRFVLPEAVAEELLEEDDQFEEEYVKLGPAETVPFVLTVLDTTATVVTLASGPDVLRKVTRALWKHEGHRATTLKIEIETPTTKGEVTITTDKPASKLIDTLEALLIAVC